MREKNLDTNVCCYMRVCICLHISPELSAKTAWEQQTSVPVSILSVQDVVSECCSLLKPGLFGDMTDSRAKAEGAQDEPGTSCYVGK